MSQFGIIVNVDKCIGCLVLLCIHNLYIVEGLSLSGITLHLVRIKHQQQMTALIALVIR